MAQITREQIAPLHEKITVSVSPADYTPAFEKSLKTYSKTANIPGFRKGMVPTGIIKKMHGAAVFTEEVLKTIENELMQYLQKENISYLGQPLPEDQNDPAFFDHNQPKDYSFAFEIGLKPEFSLPDFGTLQTTLQVVEPTEEMVNEEIDRIQRRLGNMTEPETISNDEDILNVTFTKSDASGTPLEDAAPKDNSLLLNYFSKSMQAELKGKKKDDTLVIQVGTAFEDKERDWVASDLGLDKDNAEDMAQSFQMKITKIGFVEKKEMNEDFFKEAIPAKEIKTEEEFRSEIRNQISAYWKHQAQHMLEHEVFHILSEDIKMDFPEAFLKKWLFKTNEQKQTEEQIEADFPNFRNQLRWTLVSNEIASNNTINVSREEIMDSLRQQLMGYFGNMNMGMGGNFEWLDSYVEKLMGDQQQVENAYQRVFSSKVLSYAASLVKPTEKKVTISEFQALQEKHQH
jgi:trigger factor